MQAGNLTDYQLGSDIAGSVGVIGVVAFAALWNIVEHCCSTRQRRQERLCCSTRQRRLEAKDAAQAAGEAGVRHTRHDANRDRHNLPVCRKGLWMLKQKQGLWMLTR
jgi:hypothetical protein